MVGVTWLVPFALGNCGASCNPAARRLTASLACALAVVAISR